MKRLFVIFSILFLISFFVSSSTLSALDEETTYKSVVKIRNYTYNSTSDTYTVSSIGSAVVIGTGLLLTNAHVIFDEDQMGPSDFYEICRTLDFKKKTVCFTTADLLAYDETNDLALLKFYQPSDLPVAPIFQEKNINIGAGLILYGYPSIGWENITRTEWKVAGFEDSFYKIDGAVDHGNSWGWAFNKYGELVGIPSRVTSDNAVIGYMIPISVIHDFLAKRTKGYAKHSVKATEHFKEFIRTSQFGDRSKDVINDANIKTSSLKKFGLKFGAKLEGTKSFLYSFNLNNLLESSMVFWCFQLAGGLSLSELDERDDSENLKKYKKMSMPVTTSIGNFRVDMYESLVTTDSRDKVNIYNLDTACAAYLPKINLKKDKAKIDKAISFVTTWITIKKPQKQTTGFQTPIFRIASIPAGISLATSPWYGWEDAVMMGYFSPKADTGETLDYITHKKKDTLDSYFLGGGGYFDLAPSDTDLKPEDYSFESYKKIYEKEYSGEGYSNTSFALIETKNHKKILIGTADYRSSDSSDNKTYSYIVVAYPYVVTRNSKKEYHELTYSNSYKWGNSNAISAIKQFFVDFEPIGDAPF